MPHGYLVAVDTTKALKLVGFDSVRLLDHHQLPRCDEPATDLPAPIVRYV